MRERAGAGIAMTLAWRLMWKACRGTVSAQIEIDVRASFMVLERGFVP
jgi:hypothetical protein